MSESLSTIAYPGPQGGAALAMLAILGEKERLKTLKEFKKPAETTCHVS